MKPHYFYKDINDHLMFFMKPRMCKKKDPVANSVVALYIHV